MLAGTGRREGGHPGGRVGGAKTRPAVDLGESGDKRKDPEGRARGQSRPDGRSPGFCYGATKHIGILGREEGSGGDKAVAESVG